MERIISRTLFLEFVYYLLEGVPAEQTWGPIALLVVCP
jgi:hypothetical protein